MVKLRHNYTPRGRAVLEVAHRAATVTIMAMVECDSTINLVAEGLLRVKRGLSEVHWD